MSKSKEDEEKAGDASQLNSGGNPSATETDLMSIEDHRNNFAIEAPVFAAVTQAEGWAGGKKIPEAEFLSAVKKFLKGSAGGQ